MPKVRWLTLCMFCSKFHTVYAFQQCKNFKNLLRFHKVTESLKVGTFLRHSVQLDYSRVATSQPGVGFDIGQKVSVCIIN